MRCSATRYRSSGEEPCGSVATVVVAPTVREGGLLLWGDPLPRCDQHLLAMLAVLDDEAMVMRVAIYERQQAAVEALRRAETDEVDSDTND